MRPGSAYTELLSSTDSAMMPWLRNFQVSPQGSWIDVLSHGQVFLCKAKPVFVKVAKPLQLYYIKKSIVCRSVGAFAF